MMKNRMIPTVGIGVLIPLWVLAQNPTPAPSPAPEAAAAAKPSEGAAPPTVVPPTEAEVTLDEAAKKVAALNSVSADLVQTVAMLKQEFEVKGRYLKAPGERTYLRLVVSGLPDSSGEMLQVSDGVTLWDYQQILESKYYRKVTLGPIREKLSSPELEAAERDQVNAQLGFAGPDTLLTGLRKSIRFDQKEEGTLDGRPVWILRGTWQDRQGLLGPNQQPLPETAALPAYIPSQATVYLGKEDGWPYKIRLAGRMPTVLLDTRPTGPDGRKIGAKSSIQTIEPSVVEMNYSIVSLDPTIPSKEFDFSAPAGARVEDSTEAILNGLEQMIQSKIAQKKAETARSEPILNQSINVPRPAPPADGTVTPPPLSKPR